MGPARATLGDPAPAPAPRATESSATKQPGGTIPRLLTTARDVRQLTPQEAGRGHPVRIRATVTGFRSYSGSGYFVVDETGPIFISFSSAASDESVPLGVGQVLEIEGVTSPGAYAPQVLEQKRNLVGHAPLPAPKLLNYEQLASGREDCQYAEIEGIVRAVTRNGLVLAMGEGRVDVNCSAHDPSQLQPLVDARVRLRGVVSGRFNQRRQWVAGRFNVSSLDSIIVERPAPANPFAAPPQASGELLTWEHNQAGRHRVKIRGVVTHFQPEVALFVRDGSIGLQVRTNQRQTLAPGDEVEVLGFPVLGTYSGILEDAVFRRVGEKEAPIPHASEPEDLLRGRWDASLVSVSGVLLESVRRQAAHVLVMQSGDIIFHAQLDHAGENAPPLPVAGSLLELTGICVVAETTITGAKLHPGTFSLLLRSPRDIRVVQGPSWWTTQRLWQALGVISVAALGILSWVWLLQRQVRAQTEALKDQARREAVLEERTRIAQELHDTLDQELTGISLQLNVAAGQVKDDSVNQRLEVVHRLLKRSQSEVRRSVWDLRRPPSEPSGLAGALEDTAAQLRNGSTASLAVTVNGAARPLPALTEHHLRRIAAEAVTNAFKHAGAGRIDIELTYQPDVVHLSIADDGCGFVTEHAPGPANGHFGLIGMRERCRKVGGTFTLESTPGRGTRIDVRLPEPHVNGHTGRAVRKDSPHT
jgi:signal transduction histidine kinase